MKRKARKAIFIIVLSAGLLSGVTAGGFFSLARDLPQVQSLENFKPSAVTRVYTSDQILLAELYLQKRDPVPVDQIPQTLITALLTTEDRRFYEHSGLAIRGILRAIVKNIRSGRYAEGASTLTQQLAKTLFLTPRKTLTRKLREAILALQLERRYTKNEILGLYLNQIYLGSGAYGVAAAARTYFDKALNELTLAECALLAGLPKAPSRFSPLVNPDLARKRRDTVLVQMKDTGVIDEQTYRQATRAPVVPPHRSDGGPTRKAPYFIDYITKRVEAIVGAGMLYKGGLTIHTTLSSRMQTAAEAAVEKGLIELEMRMQQNGIANPAPQAALVALNNTTGGITSLVGGRNFEKSSFNRATEAQRQPGSAFKPLVFAPAIEQGFSQTNALLDAPVLFDRPLGDGEWRPENFSQSFAGEVCLRWALVHSQNIPAVRLIEKLGPSSVVRFAHNMGLTSALKSNLTLALGASEIKLHELTAAYAVFANRGKYIRPYGVTEILDMDGKVLFRARPQQSIAMSSQGAAIMTDMLSAVIDEGTGRGAKGLPKPLAGKTGTTDEFKDALFIGYSPSTTCGVWVGNDDATTLGPGETGARAALPVWKDYMQTALTDEPRLYFDIPDGVERIYIHPRTGAELTAGVSGAVRVMIRRNGPRNK